MKKFSALMLLVLAACGPAINLEERPRFPNGVNTLTFMLYNSFTGAAITDATPATTVTLRIGNYTLTGENVGGNVWTVANVPPGTHLVEIASGGFVSYLGRPVASGNGSLDNPSSYQYPAPYTVPMYPTGSVAQAIEVEAYEQETGAAVASGTVVATLTTSNFGASFQNVLPGAPLLRPTTVVATIANGLATLPAADLILGGTYSIDIYGATNASGKFLTPIDNVTIDAGRDFPNVTLFLGPPSAQPFALTATNEADPEQVTNLLRVTFPYPMEFCSESAEHGWNYLTVRDGNANGIYGTPATPIAVSASISAAAPTGGSTLSLSPQFATGMEAADGRQQIYFYNVRLRIVGSSSCYYLEDILLRDSDYVDTAIRIQ